MKPILITMALSLLLVGCTTRPVSITGVEYPPLAKGTEVLVSFAADQPAPAPKRFAFTIRQIGVGSQSDLNSALENGVLWAKRIGAQAIHVAISEPETRRQKVEVSFYRLTTTAAPAASPVSLLPAQ